ncbi:hypothetical protein [Xylocopilactobacillus apicola]|uniref:Lipoprotein n=1 Tax=Xylocopilactobacillus apicola TaxID=2932184 RepID=A0AAU9D8R5_9LACO|nr:hypothetical protein [Xylocopilactobacillus apicola]BDR57865.1 hypothetical protein XA3_03060 [Xylocopilactobacillus apicola]
MKKQWILIATLLGIVLLASGCQAKNSASNVEELTVNEFGKRLPKLEGSVVFFGDPSGEGYDQALEDMNQLAKEYSAKMYKVNIDNEDGRKLLERQQNLTTPYDAAVVMPDGKYILLELKKKGLPSKENFKKLLAGDLNALQ